MRTAVAQTSIAAYDAIKASGTSTHQCGRILKHILTHGGDWSIGEIAHALNMEKSTVSARLNAMLNEIDPPIEAKPTRKDRVSGVTVRPVGLPVAGQQELFSMTATEASGTTNSDRCARRHPVKSELRLADGASEGRP